MRRNDMTRAAVATAALALLLLATARVNAQETGDNWARWWYGGGFGINIDIFSGTLRDPGTSDQDVANPRGFDAGSGLGLTIFGMIEYNSGALLGGNVMLGYDNRKVNFDTKNATRDSISKRSNEGLTTNLSYFTIEPNVRINLGNRFLHLMLGPSFSINLGKSYEYSFTDSTGVAVTRSADLANSRSFVLGGQLGLGYDIPLTTVESRPQILITPFAQFRLGQDLLNAADASTDEFTLNTIRIGAEIKFGTPATVVDPDLPSNISTDFSVRAPNIVTNSRRLNETFPMRNYIFFDAGSTEIPSRYKSLSSSEAGSFREEQLIKPTVETGAADAMQVRSRRQMEVYYNGLNVFGDRLRRNPSATLALTGSANGDAAAGKRMAENVRNYLVSTFGIDGKRITTDGKPMPTHKSGSGNAKGEDKKLVDAENYRVEIIGNPPEIMQPVNILSIQDEPIDNDIVFTLPEGDGVDSWTIEITERDGGGTGGGGTKSFGPYRGQRVVRIDSKSLLGNRSDARFNSKVTVKGKDGKSFQSDVREFRLVSDDEDIEQTGTRYSILFEFDESKTVQTYETFLSQSVAPSIPNGASVIIHGHTDLTGDPDYNQKLSQKRSDETQKILERELLKAGKKATFDTYGFGEDERRSPFNNTLPEQRYYNRTVVVEVIPGQ